MRVNCIISFFGGISWKGYDEADFADFLYKGIAKVVQLNLNIMYEAVCVLGVRWEPISKSCEITQADNLNGRRRLSRKAQ